MMKPFSVGERLFYWSFSNFVPVTVLGLTRTRVIIQLGEEHNGRISHVRPYTLMRNGSKREYPIDESASAHMAEICAERKASEEFLRRSGNA